MPQTLIELGGAASSPLLHLAPANGFPPQIYAPMLSHLSADFRCFSFPPRPLWDDEQEPPEDFGDWRDTAQDLLNAFERANMRDILLVGHSLGANVSMMAVNMAPELFRGLAMLDPVILPPEWLVMLRQAALDKALDRMPQVQGALRRRRTFATREAAFERFRSRAQFADWSDEALGLYIKHGLKARRDEAGFELAWSADWEISYFASIHPGAWEELAALDGRLPLMIARGSGSDTISAGIFKRVSEILPSATMIELGGQGHLFPMAAPKLSARVIRDWLGKSAQK